MDLRLRVASVPSIAQAKTCMASVRECAASCFPTCIYLFQALQVLQKIQAKSGSEDVNWENVDRRTRAAGLLCANVVVAID